MTYVSIKFSSNVVSLSLLEISYNLFWFFFLLSLAFLFIRNIVPCFEKLLFLDIQEIKKIAKKFMAIFQIHLIFLFCSHGQKSI